jgi:hypothetical protein
MVCVQVNKRIFGYLSIRVCTGSFIRFPCMLQENYGGYGVVYAGRNYAAVSQPVFLANGTYHVTSLSLVWSSNYLILPNPSSSLVKLEVLARSAHPVCFGPSQKRETKTSWNEEPIYHRCCLWNSTCPSFSTLVPPRLACSFCYYVSHIYRVYAGNEFWQGEVDASPLEER